MNSWLLRSLAFVMARASALRRDDRGAGTVEYAVCVLVGAAFAVVLYLVVNDDEVSAQLGRLIARAIEMDV